MDFPKMDLQKEVAAFKAALEMMQAQGYCLAEMIYVKPDGNGRIAAARIPGQTIQVTEDVMQLIHLDLAMRGPDSEERHKVRGNHLTDGIKPN